MSRLYQFRLLTWQYHPRLEESRIEWLDVDYDDLTEEKRNQLEEKIVNETGLENFDYGVLGEHDVLLPNGEITRPHISEIDIAGYMVSNGPTFYDYTDNRSIDYFSTNHELILKLELNIEGEDFSFEEEEFPDSDLRDALELIIFSHPLGPR